MEAIKQIAITTALALVFSALVCGIGIASLLIGWKGFSYG